MDNLITKSFCEHLTCTRMLFENVGLIDYASNRMVEALQTNNVIFFCGNGGSAGDAQHLAAELIGRFMKERRPLPAIALHCNSSAVTAIGNDYGYKDVFSRQLSALGKEGDILVAISTSGNSENVINAAKVARSIGVKVIALTGESGGKLREFATVWIPAASNNTARIQEMHILIGHVLCQLIEEKMFGTY